MSYDLSQLGWKAFQDVAAAIAAEVLKRPVQTFLGSNDGGRDAAFIGRWDGPGDTVEKSTVQCKFLGKPGANLTLPSLKAELPKAKKLTSDGLADDYVILTNAGVSGEADAEICAAFEAVGVKSGKLAPGDPTTRAKAAEIQVAGLSPEVSFHPRRRLQHLQHPAASDPPTDPSPLPGRGSRDVGGRHRRGLIR